jgi:hypothetical protein
MLILVKDKGTNMNETVFEVLSSIDVSKHVESKGGFSYLPWADAWNYVKSSFPDARYENKMFEVTIDGNTLQLPYCIDHNGYAYVQTTVEIDDEVQTEDYPVLDYRNKPVQNPDSFQVNTSLKRSLAKACANHGLGLYIYRGEDLPDAGEKRIDGTVPKNGELTVNQNIKIDRLSRNRMLKSAETDKIREWMRKHPSEEEAEDQIKKIETLIKKRKSK